MSIFSADIFTRLNWLTRKVNILLAYMARTIQQKNVEDENNPPYLEIVWLGGTPTYTTLGEYNVLFGDGSHNPIDFIPFTALVTINSRIQRFYGGGNVVILSGDLTPNGTLASIDDPKGVITTLGAGAFQGNNDLSYVNLPGVTSIDDFSVFETCASLTYVNLPNLESIGPSAYNTFYSCPLLQKVNLPRLNIIRADSTFEGCIALSNISLPSLNNIFASSTFYGCTNLKNISLPNCISYNSTTCSDNGGTFNGISGITATLTASRAAYGGCSTAATGIARDIEELLNNNTITVIPS